MRHAGVVLNKTDQGSHLTLSSEGPSTWMAGSDSNDAEALGLTRTSVYLVSPGWTTISGTSSSRPIVPGSGRWLGSGLAWGFGSEADSALGLGAGSDPGSGFASGFAGAAFTVRFRLALPLAWALAPTARTSFIASRALESAAASVSPSLWFSANVTSLIVTPSGSPSNLIVTGPVKFSRFTRTRTAFLSPA